MVNFEVEVKNDVYTDTYTGTSLSIDESVNGNSVINVKKDDGTYTTHQLKYVKDITLAT